MVQKGKCIMLADESALIRSGMSCLIRSRYPDTRIREADSSHDCLRIFSEGVPDLGIIGFSLKGLPGFECARRLLSRYTEAVLLVIARNNNPTFSAFARRIGARGLLTPDATGSEFLNALQTLLNGGHHLPASENGTNPSRRLPGTGLDSLSMREHEILTFILRGYSTSQIADSLNVSIKTVANHRTRIMHKMNASNTMQLFQLAADLGLRAG